MPRWSPVMRTEKSPDLIACSACKRSSSGSGCPFALGLRLELREGVPAARSLMASPGAECALLCRLDAIPPHKTDCSQRDQQGTADDAAKPKLGTQPNAKRRVWLLGSM